MVLLALPLYVVCDLRRAEPPQLTTGILADLLLTGAACISVLALNINFQVSQVTVPNTTPLLILSGIILSIVTILALLQQ